VFLEKKGTACTAWYRLRPGDLAGALPCAHSLMVPFAHGGLNDTFRAVPCLQPQTHADDENQNDICSHIDRRGIWGAVRHWNHQELVMLDLLLGGFVGAAILTVILSGLLVIAGAGLCILAAVTVFGDKP
jgi:hypothetical protein